MKNKFVREIIQYINDHLEEDISLGDISKRVHYSPYYCSASFHQEMGTSIRNYILKLRLHRAATTLANTSDKIIDIALRYGYGSQEAFSRAFFKNYGLRPSTYRKNPMPLVLYFDQKKEGENLMNKEIVKSLHETIHNKYQRKVLHILNGMSMLSDFKNQDFMKVQDTYIPFNEAMCWGPVHPAIFSKAFVEKRVEALNTRMDDYEEKVIQSLKPLFEGHFKTLVLWFGSDMFCQMNLLTLLAYLDSVDFQGDVLVCLKNEVTDEMLADAFPVEVKGYHKIYKTIMCDHKMVEESLIPLMYQGIQMYLDYRKEDSEINKYIHSHIRDEDQVILKNLMAIFSQYGLGDLQYKMMIQIMKASVKM